MLPHDSSQMFRLCSVLVVAVVVVAAAGGVVAVVVVDHSFYDQPYAGYVSEV